MYSSAVGTLQRLPSTAQAWVTAVTVVLGAVVVWQFGWSPGTPALLALVAFGVVLAAIDLRERILPNALLLPFSLVATTLLVLASALSGQWAQLIGAGIGALAMFGVYLILALVSPGSLGMGDVKLAAILGLYGGYAGMAGWLTTFLGGFVLGGMIGLALLLFTKASGRSSFPFGPPMLASCMVAMMVYA